VLVPALLLLLFPPSPIYPRGGDGPRPRKISEPDEDLRRWPARVPPVLETPGSEPNGGDVDDEVDESDVEGKLLDMGGAIRVIPPEPTAAAAAAAAAAAVTDVMSGDLRSRSEATRAARLSTDTSLRIVRGVIGGIEASSSSLLLLVVNRPRETVSPPVATESCRGTKSSMFELLAVAATGPVAAINGDEAEDEAEPVTPWLGIIRELDAELSLSSDALSVTPCCGAEIRRRCKVQQRMSHT
jgi:hypothetical protein